MTMNNLLLEMRYFSRKSPLSACIIFVCFFLTACDGGIFGTGDGNPPVLVLEPPPDGGPPPIEGPQPTPPALDELDIEFTNTLSSSLRGDALIKLVHASTGLQDSIVITDRGDIESPLVPLPGLSFEDHQTSYISLTPNIDHDLDIFLSEEFRQPEGEKFWGIYPMSLSAGSTTTILARGDDDFSDTQPEIVILQNIAKSGDSNGLFRVIHAASHFEQNGAVDVFILPEGTAVDGQADPTFNAPLSYENYDTGYIRLEPGRYELTATNVGSDDIRIPTHFPIELNQGQVLTFLIRDDITGTLGQDVEILILQDSTLPDE